MSAYEPTTLDDLDLLNGVQILHKLRWKFTIAKKAINHKVHLCISMQRRLFEILPSIPLYRSNSIARIHVMDHNLQHKIANNNAMLGVILFFFHIDVQY